MTGAPPVPNRPALWAALSHMRIEEPGTARRFEEALAEEEGWPLDFAERVADEYRRFLYLAATAGFEVTPSRAVDQAWHLHLDCPHYREVLCGQILRRPLDHRPALGLPGEEERHRRQYRDTLALYERAFLKPAPPDIWPAPISPGERQAEESRRRGRKLAGGIAAGTGLAAIAAYAIGQMLAALFLAVAAAILAFVGKRLRRRKARLRGGSGCGGSCGSGGGLSGDFDSGAASCGSGGCGGD
ncbi:MAG TPA: hypothetical protein VGA98_05460 [Allosphingosinicella sp.]